MLEVADIIRLHGAAYREQFGETLSSIQKQALRDIAACRTPFFGGHVYQCDHCRENVFAYHSCVMGSVPLWGVGCSRPFVILAESVF
jgi:hypothetical protein